MFRAPVVACEISDPPTTPRGTSRSAPGLTTFIRRTSLQAVPPLDWATGLCRFDLDRRLRRYFVIHLERGVSHAEALAEHPLELAAQLVTVRGGAHRDVRGERGEARGHFPNVEIVDLDHSGVRREPAADRAGVEAGRSRLHEH